MSIIVYREIKVKIKCVEFERKEIMIMMDTMTNSKIKVKVDMKAMMSNELITTYLRAYSVYKKEYLERL